MRSKIYMLSVIITMITGTGCEKYTDIVPKGQNLLNRASDLELLINVNFQTNSFNFIKQANLINDMYTQAYNVPAIISSNVMTINKILLTYDESADRASLTPGDAPYEGLYRIISTVANIVIANADKASGDQQLKDQLKAEAYILRAYLHYLLVNVYARAYDPVTAATDGGIPYVTTIDIETVNKKNTVQEVYDGILKDIEAALVAASLPDQPKNYMRVGKGFAYAVKAKVLMSMRNYGEALNAVNEAMKLHTTLEDHRPLLAIPKSSRMLVRSGINATDNVFYASLASFFPNTFTSTYEILANYYEPGNIVKDSTNTFNYELGFLYVGLPNIPAYSAFTYEGNSAGITTSDLYLMKAECLIRTNKIDEGMALVNDIRIRRIAPYAPLSASDEASAMAHFQKTSRIESLYKIWNFIDIKRWNKEGKYPVLIERTISGTKYTLQPDSKLYVFPFPQSATQFNETLTQNY
jgi:hypothetical protein